MSYATQTDVPVEKSRAEIEKLLTRAGASKFAYMTDEGSATIGFVLNGKMVRFNLPLPDRADKSFWRTPARHYQRTQDEAFRAWEQACRSKWRALLLCVKSKLEAVECGITSFEQEFLAHIVIGNGRTVGETIIPQIEEAQQAGVMPRLQLGFGGEK